MEETARKRSGFWHEVSQLVDGTHSTQNSRSKCGPFVTIPEEVYTKYGMNAKTRIKTYKQLAYRGTALSYVYDEKIGNVDPKLLYYTLPEHRQTQLRERGHNHKERTGRDTPPKSSCDMTPQQLRHLMKQTKAFRGKAPRVAAIGAKRCKI